MKTSTLIEKQEILLKVQYKIDFLLLHEKNL